MKKQIFHKMKYNLKGHWRPHKITFLYSLVNYQNLNDFIKNIFISPVFISQRGHLFEIKNVLIFNIHLLSYVSYKKDINFRIEGLHIILKMVMGSLRNVQILLNRWYFSLMRTGLINYRRVCCSQTLKLITSNWLELI